MKKNLSKREKILVGITMLAAAYGFFSYYYSPMKKEIKKNYTQIYQLKEEVTRIKTEVEVLTALNQRSVSSVTPGGLLAPQMETSEEQKFARLLGLMTKQNDLDDLEIKEIRMAKLTEQASFTVSNMELTVESSFVMLGKFLERLEESTLAVKVNGMKIFRVKNDLRRIEAKLEIEGYVPK